jgi:hypothetical protein
MQPRGARSARLFINVIFVTLRLFDASLTVPNDKKCLAFATPFIESQRSGLNRRLRGSNQPLIPWELPTGECFNLAFGRAQTVEKCGIAHQSVPRVSLRMLVSLFGASTVGCDSPALERNRTDNPSLSPDGKWFYFTSTQWTYDRVPAVADQDRRPAQGVCEHPERRRQERQ